MATEMVLDPNSWIADPGLVRVDEHERSNSHLVLLLVITKTQWKDTEPADRIVT